MFRPLGFKRKIGSALLAAKKLRVFRRLDSSGGGALEGIGGDPMRFSSPSVTHGIGLNGRQKLKLAVTRWAERQKIFRILRTARYSIRSVIAGSVRLARIAAGTVAKNAVARSTSHGAAIICASVGLTS